MDSFSDSEFSGILEIFVHHARNIHNICIYDNQDVYAKFSLTYNPDETLSTQIINGGGKNPEFNEKLVVKVTQLEAILKCEIWMLSRARSYMEDQLLGFALVPISQVVGKGKVITQDYNLSSTDLFHSPAGTVKLSLSLNTHRSPLPMAISKNASSSSISSEVVLLGRKMPEPAASTSVLPISDPVEYSRIEFPDISIVKENQKMVSEYFNGAFFLHLGTSPRPVDDNDYEMAIVNSPNGSIQNSTTTSLSDEYRNSSADSLLLKKNHSDDANNPSVKGITSPDTPTSKADIRVKDKENCSEDNLQNHDGSSKFGQVFSGNINIEAEQAAMQQQIVDMYMRSMQQFTESLAKMKLPMDLDKHPPESQDQSSSNRIEPENKNKNGSRVFYGSRAFF